MDTELDRLGRTLGGMAKSIADTQPLFSKELSGLSETCRRLGEQREEPRVTSPIEFARRAWRLPDQLRRPREWSGATPIYFYSWPQDQQDEYEVEYKRIEAIFNAEVPVSYRDLNHEQEVIAKVIGCYYAPANPAPTYVIA